MKQKYSFENPRESVKVIIVDEDNNVLVIDRAAHDTHRPKQGDLPGGGLDDQEDPLKGAVREVWEETGLLIEDDELLPGPVNEAPSSDGTFLNRRFFFLHMIEGPRPGVVLDPDEHSAFEWSQYPEAYSRLGHMAHQEAVAWWFDMDHAEQPAELQDLA
jgi:8-oxo-dGTP pyrophosphatase MutT (NUDIX family)